MSTFKKVSIIIVTYNSQSHIPKAMACLHSQTKPADQIILVDTGSTCLNYLRPYTEWSHVELVTAEKESGFCKGNNLGFKKVPKDQDYVFLLNPDAFIAPNFIEKAIEFMENPSHAQCGAITGITLGYDINNDRPTGKYDTTGLSRKWYGKWVDRAQGLHENPALFCTHEPIQGICGAVFFCRKQALDQVLIRNNEILDNTFYMYKEDIDLSLRLRNKGWTLNFVPTLVAYHCRGWNQDRKQMPRRMRLCSAKNELRIQAKQLSPIGMVYSGLKYAFVKFFDI